MRAKAEKERGRGSFTSTKRGTTKTIMSEPLRRVENLLSKMSNVQKEISQQTKFRIEREIILAFFKRICWHWC